MIICVGYRANFDVGFICIYNIFPDLKPKLEDASPQLAFSSDPCDPSEYCTTGDTMPYPGNCQKYYWCLNSVWQEMDCAAGTLFDNVTKECTLPSAARCQPECPPVTATTPSRTTINPGLFYEFNVIVMGKCINIFFQIFRNVNQITGQCPVILLSRLQPLIRFSYFIIYLSVNYPCSFNHQLHEVSRR